MDNPNFYSKSKRFHRFTTDNFALCEIGLGIYDLSSIYSFFGLNSNGVRVTPPNPDIVEFFSNQDLVARDRLIGLQSTNTMTISSFDEEEKIYEELLGLINIAKLNPQRYPLNKYTRPPINIKQILQDWDDIQLGVITDQKKIDGYRAFVNKIKSSEFGYIAFEVPITILGRSTQAKVRLYFLDSVNNTPSRKIAFKGAPLMNIVPKTAYDVTYSSKLTSEASVGQYIGEDGQGENNPDNATNGPLRAVWDPSTGEFHSGTQQILAVLMEDIDPASFPRLTAEQLAGLSREEVYGGENAPAFMGKFTKGKALPLSTENGNPHLFGPDFLGNCDGVKTARVMAINRLNQRYKTGDTVVLSKMLGESGNWIIVSPGIPEEPKKTLSIGSFNHQQYIIPLKYYFTGPKLDNSSTLQKLMPDVWESKIRDDYYTNLPQTPMILGENSLIDLKILNCILSNADDKNMTRDKAIDYLRENYNNGLASIGQSRNNAKIGNQTVKLFYSIMNQNIVSYTDMGIVQGLSDLGLSNDNRLALPKNTTKNSAREFGILGVNEIGAGVGDPLYGEEVPMFWGLLYPDGYTLGSCNNLKNANPAINTAPLYFGDTNLSEMSAISTSCIPDTGDDDLNTLIGLNLGGSANNVSEILQSVKKTGGLYSDATKISLDHLDLYNRISLAPSTAIDGFQINPSSSVLKEYNYINSTNFKKLQKLSPLNPRRIQFSPMSIEFLYSAVNFDVISGNDVGVNEDGTVTILYTAGFSHLATEKDYYKNYKYVTGGGWTSHDLITYAQFLWGDKYKNPIYTSPKTPFRFTEDSGPALFLSWGDGGNTYNISSLPYSYAFSPYREASSLFNRHPSPQGTAYRIIPPPFGAASSTYGDPICPVVPVITSKFTVSTNSTGLNFDIFQLAGMAPQITIEIPRSPRYQALPFGAGLFSVEDPGKPSKELQTVQWGDRAGTDDIDHLGTTALHVRVFESLPWHQSIYLGHINTPLYFNPSDTNYRLFTEYNETFPSGRFINRLDDDNQRIKSISEVDFRIPTYQSGGPIPANTTLTSENPSDQNNGVQSILTDYKDWKYDTVRRGKLLSGGGFAYFQNIIAVSDAIIDPENRGLGYNTGDEFVYPDGYKIEVTGIGADGQILSIKKTLGYDAVTFISKNNDAESATSLNENQPLEYVPVGDSRGTGAKFKVNNFKVVKKIGYDKAPKEVVPSTRISIGSNRGEAMAEGNNTTSVQFSETDASKFDVYYFFHNDPTHYSMSRALAYNGPWAQFIISEVNPI